MKYHFQFILQPRGRNCVLSSPCCGDVFLTNFTQSTKTVPPHRGRTVALDGLVCVVRTSSIPIPAIERKRIGAKHFRILAEARLRTHTLYHPASACAVNVTCHISVLSDMCAFTRNSLRLRTKTKTRNRTAASGVGGEALDSSLFRSPLQMSANVRAYGQVACQTSVHTIRPKIMHIKLAAGLTNFGSQILTRTAHGSPFDG